MSFPYQDWTPVVLTKRTRTKSGNTQTVPKQHINKTSNGIKVEKLWDPKDPNAEPETRPVMVSKELGQQIQKARTEREMTQRELASAISIPSTVINDYERGEGVYNITHVNKIKKFLGITKNGSK
jgi:ribosome-binding protein aMBF1 (putative translation factor)